MATRKRPLDGPAAGNDARLKLKEPLAPFDQSRDASTALLMQACYSVLEARPDRALAARGLMAELNAAVAPGAFTKRGEARPAAAYVKQVLGGCKAWVSSLPPDVFEVVGSWDDGDVAVRLREGRGSPMVDDDDAAAASTPLEAGARRTGRVAFWDRRQGWGRVSLDGDASRRRVFVHWRDVRDRNRLPRGARVELTLAESEKGWAGTDVKLLETTDAEVDALLAAGSAMALDDAGQAAPAAPFAPIDPAPPALGTPPPPPANSPDPDAAAAPDRPPARPVTP